MDLSPGAPALAAALACALLVSVVLLVTSRIQLRRARRRLAALENSVEPLTNRAAKAAGKAAGRAMRGAVGTAVQIREHGVRGMLRSSIEELTGFALEDKQAIDRVIGEDGTVTIVFSDIEDSTMINERLGDDAFVA